jgi:hypothetical protein
MIGLIPCRAAPIASLMMEKYLRDSISRPELEEKMYKGYLLPLLNKGPENGVLKRDSIVTEKKKGGKGIRGDTGGYGCRRLHTVTYGRGG